MESPYSFVFRKNRLHGLIRVVSLAELIKTAGRKTSVEQRASGDRETQRGFTFILFPGGNHMLETTIDVAENRHVAEAGIGDVVTLKSGGPRMTIMYAGPVGFAAGHWLICQWFDEQGELRQDMFAQDMVQIQPRSISAASVKLRQPSRRSSAGRA
jgi:uncharacterized protein YodC (DUF2158 family)